MPTPEGIFKGIVVPELPWKTPKVETKPPPEDLSPDVATCSECGKALSGSRCPDCGLDF